MGNNVGGLLGTAIAFTLVGGAIHSIYGKSRIKRRKRKRLIKLRI